MHPTAAATLDARTAAYASPAFACSPAHQQQQQQPPVQPIDLEPYRASLMGFARAMLRDDAQAEDAVQDTLLAALASPASFAGRSSVKTWLHGILKHKIADTFRRHAREVPLVDDSDEETPDETFTTEGRWREPPSAWRCPEAALSQRHFFDVLEGCIAALPPNTARVFTMREILGLDTAEICRTLGISQSNCGVMLYRARMKLRALLERRWPAA